MLSVALTLVLIAAYSRAVRNQPGVS
jgi:hypothetical protein